MTTTETDRRCEKCGSYDVRELGDHLLCDSCYEGCGSCCPEFGADDLWQDESPGPRAEEPSATGK